MRTWVFMGIVMGCTEYGVKPGLPFGASSAEADTATDPVERSEPIPEEGDTSSSTVDTGDEIEDVPFKPSDFSMGWHLLDEGERIPTNTSSAYTVSEHGDVDSYWYEPSGNHGLIGVTNPQDSFNRLRNYILERVPEPTMGIGNLHYYADSSIGSFDEATFTYVMADFFVAASEDPYDYRLSVTAVDDGIEVIVNGEILGFLKLDEMGREWNLGPYIRLGERNTLIVLLVDNDERNKFLQDMAFFRGDIMVIGTP